MNHKLPERLEYAVKDAMGQFKHFIDTLSEEPYCGFTEECELRIEQLGSALIEAQRVTDDRS